MTLATIRTQLQSFTGELSYSSAELDFFIQQGQVLLDSLVNVSRGSRKSVTMAAGDYQVNFSTAEWIDSIRLQDSDGVIGSPLQHVDLDFLEDLYPDPANTSTSVPAIWAIDESQSQTGQQVILMPPADQVYVVKAKGSFTITALTGDSDTNFWTEKYPLLLIQAARYHIDEANNSLDDAQKRLNIILTMIDRIMAIENDRDKSDAEIIIV